jgi:Co/Zn/Cd efflux system component
MSEHRHAEPPITAQDAAKSAAIWNGAMSAVQLGVAAVTGNVGFAGESAHNAADAASFNAKRQALDCNPARARRLRKFAATILAVGGMVGIGGGGYKAVSGETENAGNLALGIAVAGATINTAVARRTHRAHHDHGPSENTSGQVYDAHDDSKLHAVSDAGTGWLYVGGLLLERHVPGGANWLVMLNGSVSAAAATVTFRRINQEND